MDNFMVRLARVLCLAFATLMVSSAMAGQANYESVYIFGDSLSDTGNDFVATSAQGMVPAIPPSVSPYKTYYKGRFSNGPVAVEYLWRLMTRKNSAELTPYVAVSRLGPAGLNFAFGGAGSGEANLTPNGFMVPGLLGQVGLYNTALAGKKSNAKALYVVWSGANDYLQNLEYDPYKIVGNVETAIRALYATGARDFLVPNLPDLGNTPLIKAQGGGATFTGFAKAHNTLLSARMTALVKALPGSRIVKLDVFALGETLVSTGLINDDVPAIKFLSPTSGAEQCLFVNPAACVDVDDLGFLAPFLYWDVLHPTTQVHGVIGTAMYAALLKQK